MCVCYGITLRCSAIAKSDSKTKTFLHFFPTFFSGLLMVEFFCNFIPLGLDSITLHIDLLWVSVLYKNIVKKNSLLKGETYLGEKENILKAVKDHY